MHDGGHFLTITLYTSWRITLIFSFNAFMYADPQSRKPDEFDITVSEAKAASPSMKSQYMFLA